MQLGFGQMLAWAASFYTLGVLAGPMAATMAIDTSTVYAMFSASLIVCGLISPWAGRVMQRRGGRFCLMRSNVGFALAHFILAVAPNPWVLALGWLVMCLSMPFGLYEAAFATVVGLYGPKSRPSFGLITVVAGLGSTLSWPLTSAIEVQFDWRAACAFWALIQISIPLAIHYHMACDKPAPASEAPVANHPNPHERRNLMMLTLSFVCIAFTFATMATHLPRILEMIGLETALAVGVASLFGVAQLAARLSDFTVLRKLPALGLARFAHGVLLLAPLLLLLGNVSTAAVFAMMHGVGIGLLTVSKGILPLELFGKHNYAAMASKAEAFARLTAALSPYLFGLALEAWGVSAMWLYFAAALMGLAAMWGLILPSAYTQHRSG